MQSTHNALVIEDDEYIRSFIRMSLLKFNYSHVDTSSNATQAIEQLKKTRYSHVFLDKGLPDADGLVLLEAIHQVSGDTKVIMCTADGSKDTIVNAMQLGIADYLVKPITASQIKKTVERLGVSAR